MTIEERIKAWKAEEEIAYIHGWDFSHIKGRYTEQDNLPWDYRQVIGQYPPFSAGGTEVREDFL